MNEIDLRYCRSFSTFCFFCSSVCSSMTRGGQRRPCHRILQSNRSSGFGLAEDNWQHSIATNKTQRIKCFISIIMAIVYFVVCLIVKSVCLILNYVANKQFTLLNIQWVFSSSLLYIRSLNSIWWRCCCCDAVVTSLSILLCYSEVSFTLEVHELRMILPNGRISLYIRLRLSWIVH